MAIQFVRDQLKDAIINPDKIDFTTGTYDFGQAPGVSLQFRTPTSDDEVAIKSYVDSAINGLNWKTSARLTTLANLAGTYANGTQGVGATYTVGGGITLDGVTMVAGDRILLKNQTNAFENGIYSMTTNGNALAPSATIVVSAFANVTAAGKGSNAITIDNAGNLTANSSTITLKDFDGNDVIMTAKASGASGQEFNIGTGGSANDDTATNLANALNTLTGGGDRLFQAIASGATVTVFFAQTGAHSGTLTNTTNAATAVSFSNGGDYTAGTSGDTFLFTKADDSTVTFDAVSSTPGALDGQFVAITSDEQTALNFATAIDADPDFNAAIKNDAPDTVIVSLATTGTGGNGKAITITVSNAGCIAQIGGSGFSGGQALGGNSVLTRTTDFDIGSEIVSGAVFIEEGTVNGDNAFTCTTNQPIQVGITDLAFVQFNGAGQIVAGDGLSKSGNTLSVNVDDNTIEIASDTLRIKASAAGNGLTGGGASALSVQNDGTTITVGVGGIKVSDAGITGTQLNTSVAGLGLSGGGGSALALDLNELTAETIASGDFLAFVDSTDNGTHKESIDDIASLFAGAGLAASSAVLSIDLSEFSAVTPAASDSFLTLDSDGSTEQRTTTDALATLFAGSGGGLQASSAVISLNLNDLSSAVVNVANDSIAIIDADDNSTKKEAISDLVSAIAGTGLSETSGVLNVGSLSFSELAFRPYIDNFTANGSTLAFALSNDINSATWVLGAVVSRNGQILKRVAASPADSSEYTIASSGGTTTVTLGANPANGELIQVNYFA